MGVTMRVKIGHRPKDKAPKIVISRKISAIQFKDENGKIVYRFTNRFSITHPQKES